MGSGKRKYRKRAVKSWLGKFKPEKDDKPKDSERVKELIELWEESKKK